MPNDCPECDGTGTLVAQLGWTRYYEPCPVCAGSGVIDPDLEENAS